VDMTVPVHSIGGATLPEAANREVAPGTPVRVRLVNTDNAARRFTLAGTAFRLVAVDGTDLSGPGELRRVGLVLAAGGRYDLEFTMPSAPVALEVGGDSHTAQRLSPPGDNRTVESATGWPDLDLTRYGTPSATPFGAGSHFDRDYPLVLDQGLALVDGLPHYGYTINGRSYPDIPSLVVRQGDLVRMTVVNRGFTPHPWHLHGHHVLVLSVDGRAPTGSPLWMDTFEVRPGQVWQVAFRADNPGLWMNHCHNLPHATQGMAMHLVYEGITGPFHGGHGG